MHTFNIEKVCTKPGWFNIRVIHRHTGDLIRALTLNPNRDYQPCGLPTDPPKKLTLVLTGPLLTAAPGNVPQPRSRPAEGHPKGPGLDHEKGRLKRSMLAVGRGPVGPGRLWTMFSSAQVSAHR
jgi:hypothetical protein